MFPYIMTLLRGLSLIGFIAANYICLLFFQQYILNLSTTYCLLLILITFMILKLDFTLLLYETIKNKMLSAYKSITSKNKSYNQKLVGSSFKDEKNESEIHNLSLIIGEVFNVKNDLIFVKVVFFNTLYELFAVYIVWISILGFLHLISFYELELVEKSSFFQISALIGLMLGIFQFILQRNEDKILTKIQITSKRIEQIVEQELTFDEFYDSIPNNETKKHLRRYIQRVVDPKLQVKDFFITLMEDKHIRRFLFKHIDKTPISINLSYQGSKQKFERLDDVVKTDIKRKKQLHDSYNSFFVSSNKVNKIVDKIYQEIDMNDFRLIVLSNINIISEILPQFTNRNYKKLIEDISLEDKRVDPKNINFSSSREYKQYLHNQVFIQLMKKIIF